MTMKNDLWERLLREEGKRNKMYKDSKGIWTIGVGYNIEEKGLPDDIVFELLDRTIEEAWEEAEDLVDRWDRIGYPRQSVVTAMVFQMGINRVRGFKRFLVAVDNCDWETAADEMLDSKWAREDSPARAERESEIMRHGNL